MNPNYTHIDDVHKITNYSKVGIGHMKYLNKAKIFACLDINCFYAQVEERDYKLEGIPLIVGGWRDAKRVSHGIVATSNYPARKFGIKTGMSALEADKLCPNVLMFQVDYDKYKAISQELREIVNRFAPRVEAYSLDEFFMDLTGIVNNETEAEAWIKAIKKDIWLHLELKVNVGISVSKSYSKIVVDFNKPDGHCVCLSEEAVRRLIYPLDVDALWGIGSRRARKLNVWGLQKIGDIVYSHKSLLQQIFGKLEGESFWLMARAEEESILFEEAKTDIDSISHMHTFPVKTLERNEIWGELVRGIERVAYRMRGFSKKGKEFSLMFRPQDAASFGFNVKILPSNFDDDIIAAFYKEIDIYFNQIFKHQIWIRGIGLFANKLSDASETQIDLFIKNHEKKMCLYEAIDKIRNKGEFSDIQLGTALTYVKGRTHFIDRSTY